MNAVLLMAMLVVPVEGEPFSGELVSIAADGSVTFRIAASEAAGDGGMRTLAAEDFVRWANPLPPQPQPLVLLADGSRLVAAADWSGGAAVQMDGDAIEIRSDSWEKVQLKRSQVSGFVFAERSHRLDRQRLELEVRAAEAKQDQVLLTNQDRLAGTVKRLAGGTLTLASDAGDVALPVSRVEAVIFAKPQAADRLTDARMIVGLRDGSLLLAKSVRAAGEGVALQTAGSVDLRGGLLEEVAALQSLGSYFVYLSDLEPASYRHVPYLDIARPYVRDGNLLGGPLQVDRKLYLKGLAMHSAARLTYRLDGNYRRFVAEAALDDTAEQRGSVTFAVYVLRDDKWVEAFNSGVVRGGDKPQIVPVDVTGAAAMTLTVDYADRGDELDHADWLDARLVK